MSGSSWISFLALIVGTSQPSDFMYIVPVWCSDMLQQLLAHTWHTLIRSYRFRASMYNYSVSVKSCPRTNLAFISTSSFIFPFLIPRLKTTEDRMMHPGVHWVLLAYTEKNFHLREMHMGKIENSASPPLINLSQCPSISWELIPPVLIYCMQILRHSWESYLFQTSTDELLGHLFPSL